MTNALLPRTGILRRLATAGVLLAGASLAPLLMLAEEGGTLTRVADIRGLSREAAAAALPVRSRGVIFWTDGVETNAIAIADDSAGIYVVFREAFRTGMGPEGAALRRSLRPGFEVEIEGATDPGGYAPMIVARRVRVLGQLPLPSAKPVDVTRLLSGAEDAQFVEVKGIVQSVAPNPVDNGLNRMLRVRGTGGCFLAIVPNASWNEEGKVVDAEVGVRGMAMPLFNTRGEITAVRVSVLRAEDLTVLREPPADPFAAPKMEMGGVLLFDPEASPRHRQVAQGVVTYRSPGLLFVQNGLRGIRVMAWSGDQVQPGDEVLISAFPEPGQGVAHLTNALVRRLGQATLPVPVDITPERMLRSDRDHAWAGWQGLPADHNGVRVTFEGRLLSWQSVGDGTETVRSLYVRTDQGTEVGVRVGDGTGWAGPLLMPGCVLRLTGVGTLRYTASTAQPEFLRPGGVELHVRGPQDVLLLQHAPFWNARRMGYVMAALGALVAAFAVWSWLLHRHVRRQTQRLEREDALKREMDLERQVTQRERHRLSADLHDSLQQSLAGLSFQLEAADGALHYGTSVEPHLTPARKLLFHLREEFRETVTALRHLEGAQDDIELSLHRVAAVQRMCGPGEIEVEIHGDPRPLPRSLVTAFVLIAQEALVNAVKHGLARNVTLQVDFQPGAVHLTVTDDGRGFDVTAPDLRSPDNGHHGLTTMAERMQRLGAELEVSSTPGTGTRVTARVFDTVIKRLAASEHQRESATPALAEVPP